MDLVSGLSFYAIGFLVGSTLEVRVEQNTLNETAVRYIEIVPGTINSRVSVVFVKWLPVVVSVSAFLTAVMSNSYYLSLPVESQLKIEGLSLFVCGIITGFSLNSR
jgi:hypothetical protein